MRTKHLPILQSRQRRLERRCLLAPTVAAAVGVFGQEKRLSELANAGGTVEIVVETGAIRVPRRNETSVTEPLPFRMHRKRLRERSVFYIAGMATVRMHRNGVVTRPRRSFEMAHEHIPTYGESLESALFESRKEKRIDLPHPLPHKAPRLPPCRRILLQEPAVQRAHRRRIVRTLRFSPFIGKALYASAFTEYKRMFKLVVAGDADNLRIVDKPPTGVGIDRLHHIIESGLPGSAAFGIGIHAKARIFALLRLVRAAPEPTGHDIGEKIYPALAQTLDEIPEPVGESRVDRNLIGRLRQFHIGEIPAVLAGFRQAVQSDKSVIPEMQPDKIHAGKPNLFGNRLDFIMRVPLKSVLPGSVDTVEAFKPHLHSRSVLETQISVGIGHNAPVGVNVFPGNMLRHIQNRSGDDIHPGHPDRRERGGFIYLPHIDRSPLSVSDYHLRRCRNRCGSRQCDECRCHRSIPFFKTDHEIPFSVVILNTPHRTIIFNPGGRTSNAPFSYKML